MNDKALTPVEYAEVVLLNDDRTPFDVVVTTLRMVAGKSEQEATEIATNVDRIGRYGCGIYPVHVAQAMAGEAARFARTKGAMIRIHVQRILDPNAGPRCSFCGKKSEDVKALFQGQGAHICGECVLASAEALSAGANRQRFNHVYELLEWHFAGCSKETIASTTRSFPDRVRADLQLAANSLFTLPALKTVGVHGGYAYEETSVSSLLQRDRNAKTIGPLRYQDVDIGDAEPIKCLENAVWLMKEGDVPFVVLLVRQKSMQGGASINIEVAAPAGEAAAGIADRIFHELEKAVATAGSYRGKVLSLEQVDMYSGVSAGIQVHRLPPVARDDLILPAKTIDLLERNVVQFASQRDALRKLGQSGKKGLLFHGPPGTGKTHTVRYLASVLPKHTTLLITSEQVALLPDYFTLARLLQPSIVVIEDADLIARDRSSMQSACEEILLNKLLNEMDGLRQDAEVFFILTTNRPEMLEAALASRPGRIDQAIEFPLPDEEGRLKLTQLYSRGMELDDGVAGHIVEKTKGVSASFIKELMRRAAQYNLARGGAEGVTTEDASAAIEEMLFSGGKLNRALLGSQGGG
jgi:ATP-dependent Clp protease adapter protein ClpS